MPTARLPASRTTRRPPAAARQCLGLGSPTGLFVLCRIWHALQAGGEAGPELDGLLAQLGIKSAWIFAPIR